MTPVDAREIVRYAAEFGCGRKYTADEIIQAQAVLLIAADRRLNLAAPSTGLPSA